MSMMTVFWNGARRSGPNQKDVACDSCCALSIHKEPPCNSLPLGIILASHDPSTPILLLASTLPDNNIRRCGQKQEDVAFDSCCALSIDKEPPCNSLPLWINLASHGLLFYTPRLWCDGCNSFDIVCVSVCPSGCTQGTLYTTTMVNGVLVHQEGAICTTQAQYAPRCTRETMFFEKFRGPWLPVRGVCLCVCNQGAYTDNSAYAVDRRFNL